MATMTDQQLQKELAKLDQVRAALLERRGKIDGIKALAEAQPMIKTGSKEHEALLSAGYKMDKAKAQTIIKERKANSASWPYEMLEKAEAFMEALTTKPTVISTRPAWQSRGRVLSTA